MSWHLLCITALHTVAGIPDMPNDCWLLRQLGLLPTQPRKGKFVLTSHFLPLDLLLWFRCALNPWRRHPGLEGGGGAVGQVNEQGCQTGSLEPRPRISWPFHRKRRNHNSPPFSELSLSHAVILESRSRTNKFLHKPENVYLGSQALCSDQDDLMRLPGGEGGVKCRGEGSGFQGSLNPWGSYKRGWVPILKRYILFGIRGEEREK